MLHVRSTSDVPLPALQQFASDLNPSFPVVVDEGQMMYRSAESPSWVMFLAEADWWLKTLAVYAAVFAAEITREGAKATWKALVGLMSRKKEEGPADRLVDALAKLKQGFPDETRFIVGLPIPSDLWATQLEIPEGEPGAISARLAVFVHHLPALLEVIRRNDLSQQACTGIHLSIEDNGDMIISWVDDDLKKRSERLLYDG